jgi:hypothetical protein
LIARRVVALSPWPASAALGFRTDVAPLAAAAGKWTPLQSEEGDCVHEIEVDQNFRARAVEQSAPVPNRLRP